MEKKPPHLIFDENTLANATDSERIFMEAMKKSLDDNWYVFHSLRFTWGERRAKRDYEIDFLLFTPLYGFLVVEVKGGAIKCSNGSYMVDGRPCDPFRQAATNMYAFKEMLLVGENKVQPDDIAVIGAHGIGNTSIGKDRVVNGYEIADGGKAGCVGYYTYMKFKGCDSKVVILLDVDEKDKRWSRAGLYTALSRATSQAFILKKG